MREHHQYRASAPTDSPSPNLSPDRENHSSPNFVPLPTPSSDEPISAGLNNDLPTERVTPTPNPQPNSTASARPPLIDDEVSPQPAAIPCQGPAQEFVIELIIAHGTNEDGQDLYKV